MLDRVTGSYPLSIATCLAMESIGMGPQKPYDPDRVVPNHINLEEYDEVWVNLLTLIRNIFGANETSPALIEPETVSEVLFDELDVIEQIIKDYSPVKKPKVFWYISKHTHLKTEFKRAKLREDRTAKQKELTDAYIGVIEDFIPKAGFSEEKFQCFEGRLQPKQKVRALVLNHYAIELLDHDKFKQLDLLESHTGAVKGRLQWYSKLYNGNNLVRIPFTKQFLQVFGDTTLISPHELPLRKAVLQIAEQYKWTPATTTDRINYGLDQIKDRFLLENLKLLK